MAFRLPIVRASRQLSTSARALSGPAKGSEFSEAMPKGGQGDAFQKREGAEEANYIRQQEQAKLKALEEKNKKLEEELAKAKK